jgi:hypothetical protein
MVMKTLYEITTGYLGESYERCYVWANSVDGAMLMFRQAYGPGGTKVGTLNPKTPREVQTIIRLFSEDDEDFITKITDDGFTRE